MPFDTLKVNSKAACAFRAYIMYIAESGEYDIVHFESFPMKSSTKLFHIKGKPSLGPGICVDQNSIPPQEPQSSSNQDNEGLLLADFNLYGRSLFLWTS